MHIFKANAHLHSQLFICAIRDLVKTGINLAWLMGGGAVCESIFEKIRSNWESRNSLKNLVRAPN